MPTSGQQARAHLVNNGREMAYSIEMTERDIFPCFHENSSRQAALQASCSKWFKQHLETQLRCVSETSDVAPECLRALDQSTLHLSLLAVLDALSQGHDTSLDTLLRQMRASLPTTVTWAADYSENENSSDDNTPLQLVFLLLGWLSMLYKPAVAREPGMLEMVLPETSTRASRFQKYGPSTATTTSSISETSRIPFPHLFASFGRRVPEEDIDVQRQTTSLDSPLAAKSIIASNIYYSNLSRVGKLKIDWVPDISQHLELDERNRSLRLFASPSFCALICLSDPQSTYPLNRLIMSPDDHDNQAAFGGLNQPFDDYCREILLSFGLIFGQDKRSRREALSNANKAWRETFQSDKLLRQLCSEPWCENILYDYLHSPPVRANYSLRHDFRFLGRNLAAVQEYMNLQSPNDFMTVLFDVRDPLRFWTFVAAIGFGSAAILLGIIQAVLAAAQVALSSPLPRCDPT